MEIKTTEEIQDLILSDNYDNVVNDGDKKWIALSDHQKVLNNLLKEIDGILPPVTEIGGKYPEYTYIVKNKDIALSYCLVQELLEQAKQKIIKIMKVR